jgi:hypothetical protein
MIVIIVNLCILQVSMLPVDNQEGFQILHYVDGQKYEPHHDYFHDKVRWPRLQSETLFLMCTSACKYFAFAYTVDATPAMHPAQMIPAKLSMSVHIFADCSVSATQSGQCSTAMDLAHPGRMRRVIACS